MTVKQLTVLTKYFPVKYLYVRSDVGHGQLTDTAVCLKSATMNDDQAGVRDYKHEVWGMLQIRRGPQVPVHRFDD
jgi:hypothetical protein